MPNKRSIIRGLQTFFSPDDAGEKLFSKEQIDILKSILSSRLVIQGKLRPVVFCTLFELQVQFDRRVLEHMVEDAILELWAHPEFGVTVTLSPWTAKTLNYHIGEYWISWIEYVDSRKGHNRRKAWKKVRYWDVELRWRRDNAPEKRVKLPSNSRERPMNFTDEQSYSYVKEFDECKTVEEVKKTLNKKINEYLIPGCRLGARRRNPSKKKRKRAKS